MSSSNTDNNLAAQLLPAVDAMQEQDQVIQFFQAALTRQEDLQLSAGEKQGLFTVMEWQRENLRKIAGTLEAIKKK